MKPSLPSGPARKPFHALTLFFCFAAIAAAQTANLPPVNYPTLGNPYMALPMRDTPYIFVSVTNVGGPNYSTPDYEAGSWYRWTIRSVQFAS
jgi:hypothetical protein